MPVNYHETFPTRWDIYAICCAKCHETKPAKFFRRQLTRAQGVARGYMGERPMTVESKYCRKCQPGHYKPSAMSIPKMYTAAYDGKVSLTRVSIDVDTKRRKAKHRSVTAVVDRWAKHRKAPWAYIGACLVKEMKVTARRLKYYVARGNGSPELLAALTALQEAMTRLRAQCALDARVQAKVGRNTTWADLTGPVTMCQLTDLWAAAPTVARSRVTPLLLNAAKTLVLDGYVPTKPPGR